MATGKRSPTRVPRTIEVHLESARAGSTINSIGGKTVVARHESSLNGPDVGESSLKKFVRDQRAATMQREKMGPLAASTPPQRSISMTPSDVAEEEYRKRLQRNEKLLALAARRTSARIPSRDVNNLGVHLGNGEQRVSPGVATAVSPISSGSPHENGGLRLEDSPVKSTDTGERPNMFEVGSLRLALENVLQQVAMLEQLERPRSSSDRPVMESKAIQTTRVAEPVDDRRKSGSPSIATESISSTQARKMAMSARVLNDKLKQERESNDKLQQEIDQLKRHKFGQERRRLQELEAQNTKLKGMVEPFVEANKAEKERVAELQEEVTLLRRSLDAARAETAAAVAAAATAASNTPAAPATRVDMSVDERVKMREDSIRTKDENVRLKRALLEVAADRDSYSQRVNELELKLSALEQDYADLQDQLKTKASRLQDHLESVTTELEVAKRQKDPPIRDTTIHEDVRLSQRLAMMGAANNQAMEGSAATRDRVPPLAVHSLPSRNLGVEEEF